MLTSSLAKGLIFRTNYTKHARGPKACVFFAYLRRYPQHAADRKSVSAQDRQHKACLGTKCLNLFQKSRVKGEEAGVAKKAVVMDRERHDGECLTTE